MNKATGQVCRPAEQKPACVNVFYTAWRKCIRRLLRLLLRTHNELLPFICADISVEGKLHIRFIIVCRKCLPRSNSCIKLCANLALRGSRSDTAKSVNFICRNIILISMILLLMLALFVDTEYIAYFNIACPIKKIYQLVSSKI